MRVFSPLPTGKAGLSAVRGLSSAMGVGVSLLLQFSLTSGGYQSVGGSRRCSRRSIPRSIPSRSWKKPRLQLQSLQGRVSGLICWVPFPFHSPRAQASPSWGRKAPVGGRIPFHILEPFLGSVWPLGMSHVCAPQRSTGSWEFRMCLELVSRQRGSLRNLTATPSLSGWRRLFSRNRGFLAPGSCRMWG